MPKYDYQCGACEHTFEVKQSFSSEPVARCPNCSEDSRRVIYSVPVVFKGSGWYVNDYGKNSSGSTPKSDSKEKESSTTKTTDAKTKSNSDGESKQQSAPAK